MHYKRIKIFTAVSALLLGLILLRLIQLQLISGSDVQDRIAQLKLQWGNRVQTKTLRGNILARNNQILAADKPEFQLHINYSLCRYLDSRFRTAELLRTSRNTNAAVSDELERKFNAKTEQISRIIQKCTHFGMSRSQIEKRIAEINDYVWNLRSFIAWYRKGPSPEILSKYPNPEGIRLSEAMADLKHQINDKDKRLLTIAGVDDIPEINKSYRLWNLETFDEVFIAQMEFKDTEGIKIVPKGHRFYPSGSTAAQTIGWVSTAEARDKKLFEGNRLAQYLKGEVAGERPGVEYVCESLLRGSRGEVFYNIDGERIEQARPKFGKNVILTIDIELQKQIENYLSNCSMNSNCHKPTAAVVIDVASGDILSLVSLPTFDLNRIRYDYEAIVSDPNRPLINRTINKQYPPGSVVKPVILIAGMQSDKITADEVIHCSAAPAGKGWPNCWIYNRYGIGHDSSWRNTARNAIKGSCNIYFSQLADRIKPEVLQKWLFDFGYGQKFNLTGQLFSSSRESRYFSQASGIISSGISQAVVSEQLPPISRGELRYFGIGQGNLRVTPLQVANSMAVIARGGLYKQPRLFITDPNATERLYDAASLNISKETLDVVRNGMSAVVNESGGTAHREFAPVLNSLAEAGVKVYGKTGSTEEPANAWFAGFAQDDTGRGIALVVVVEGGRHGSSDAAPPAREIIQMCIEAGYIGKHQP